MDHANIISLNLRNMLTIVMMVTIGWFFLHLIGNLFRGSFTASAGYSGSVSGDIGPAMPV